MAAGLTNIVLDALLVGVFRMGVAGAAAATGVSQLVGGAFPLWYFARRNSSLLRFARPEKDWRALVRACANGASELMTNLSSSIVTALYNVQLMRFAGEDGVAAYGVIMYVNFIFNAIFYGYSIGSAPVFSYHYGAGGRDELKSLLRKSLALTAVCGAFLTLAAEASAAALALGVGLQNFPEGAAAALPLRRSGMSRARSFLLGAGSGLAEPAGGVLAVCAAGLRCV